MAYANGYDEPNGIIIGNFFAGWQLFYDGRPQGQKQYANSQDDAMAVASAEVARLKTEFKCAPFYLYQDDALWTIRLQN